MTRRLPNVVAQQRREVDEKIWGNSPSRTRPPPPQSEPHNFSNLKPGTHLVKAGHGHAFFVAKGQKFRITDLHGSQIVDFLAWRANSKPLSSSRLSISQAAIAVDPNRHFSAAHTRWELRGATPAVGECLIDNAGKEILRVVEDTVKVHDMTFPCCYPELYEKLGLKGHRSCAQNMVEGLTDAGFAFDDCSDSESGGLKRNRWIESHLQVPPPFNLFQNTPFYALKGGLLSSTAGDYIEMEALGSDLVCVVSSCPWDIDDFVPPTDVLVEVGV